MSDLSSSKTNCQQRPKCLSFVLFLILLGYSLSPRDVRCQEQTPQPSRTKPRNVILLIGDGMGPGQLGLLWEYAKRAPESIFIGKKLNFERLSATAQMSAILSQPFGSLVNDSACAASQYASGSDCFPGVLGFDEEGRRTRLVGEVAHENGKAVGLVSDTRITHATPAGFAVHVTDREAECQVAEELLRSGVEVLLSGGAGNFLPRTIPPNSPYLASLKAAAIPLHSLRSDRRDLLEEAAKSYELVFDRAGLENAHGQKVLGLFASSGMSNGIFESSLRANGSRSTPTLRDLTREALRLLNEHEGGFFLMVEAGQIDWASHMNDAGTLLHEMIRFDDVLGELLDFTEARHDTLLLVTADHETGGFGISYNAHDIPKVRSFKDGAFADKAYQAEFNYVDPSLLDALYAQGESFFDFFEAFSSEPQTPEALRLSVKEKLGYEISDAEALEVLELKANRYYLKHHKDLGCKLGPDMKDRAAFYPDIRHNRAPLLARVLSARQHIVWSTGTHTHTPVFLFARGPETALRDFKGFLSSREFGQRLQVQVSE